MTKVSKISNLIKKALDEFGSMEEANKHLRNENLALKEQNQLLLRQNAGLKQEQQQLVGAVSSLNAKENELTSTLQLQTKKILENSHRLDLVEGMLAMIAGSPSVTKPLDTLINSLKILKDEGWPAGKPAQDLKSYFINTVMGDYLKSFHCDFCGTSFIVNKELTHGTVYMHYYCPVCFTWSKVKPDKSFLTGMVTGKQLENVHYAVDLKEENDKLQPLKLFLNYPCEFCMEPIMEWTDNNVKMGMQGYGWAHDKCWNTGKGKTKQYAIFLEEVVKMHRHGGL